MKQWYLIFGGPRCGTSLVANLLSESGIFFCPPGRTILGDHRNAGGYFEDVTLNRAILQSPAAVAESLQAWDGHDECGAKSPQFSLAPRENFVRFGDFKIINVCRDHNAQLKSMFQFYSAGTPTQLREVRRQYIRGKYERLRWFSDHLQFRVSYESLLTQPEKICDTLGEFVGHRLTPNLVDVAQRHWE